MEELKALPRYTVRECVLEERYQIKLSVTRIFHERCEILLCLYIYIRDFADNLSVAVDNDVAHWFGLENSLR